MQFVRDLESQVNQISELYDLAEQFYPKENFYGETLLNDHQQRKKLQEFDLYGPNSFEILKGAGDYGLLAVYLMSRRGASGLLDFSQVKVCGFRTLSWFMVGSSLGMSMLMLGSQQKFGNANTINLHRRVSQNLQTQSLLKSMQHHLMIRQGSVQDQLNR